MEWVQIYDPLGNAWLSTLAAALPILLLLGTLAILEWKAHWAALAGLASALLISVVVYGMPARTAAATAVYGAAYGLFPIGWIILNAVFLYSLTVATGQFEVVKASVARLSADRRVQALLIAFSFGAFIEGAAGFGTPVAITAALLMGLGFTPLYAAGLSLIANTAPVAYGAIGTPILTLGAVTGISPDLLSAMAGRQLPFVSLLVPAWLVVTMSGWRGLRGAWPAVLVCGGSFAIVQFLWSNYVGPELVDIMGGLVSLGSLALFCTWWKPAEVWDFPQRGRCRDRRRGPAPVAIARADLVRAWMPWVFLSVFVTVWGAGPTKAFLNGGPAGAAIYRAKHVAPPPHAVLSPAIEVPGLHRMVYREHPVEVDAVDRSRMSDPAYKAKRAEAARFSFNWLSATGTAILFAALATALFLRIPAALVLQTAGSTLHRMRWPLADHRLHALARVRHALRRHGRHARPRLHEDRLVLSLLRRDARLARRGAHRLGHQFERPLRQPAEDHRPTARPRSDPHHHGQLHRRRHGQDDRRPEHRRRHGGDESARTGRPDPAVRLLAQRRAGGDHGDHRDAAGVRLSVDGAAGITPGCSVVASKPSLSKRSACPLLPP